MLELKNIHWKTENDEEILKGVDLSIPDGKLTVLTGPNGGGKTSLAKIIAGLYTPYEGKILLNNEDITNKSITERSRKGIAYAFQQPVRFKGITVKNLLEIALGDDKLSDEKACSYLAEVGLCAREYINREADASLSGGESKRIEIAGVLARKNASVTVFDEPEAGIDLWSFESLIGTFEKLKETENRSLLIISHQERIMKIADYIGVIKDGRLDNFGKGSDILPTLLGETPVSVCPAARAAGRSC